MASTPVINLRKGHAVRHNNEVCVVVSHELKTPPRMASYVQMSIRSVGTKKIFNLRMTSNDSMDGVLLERIPHEYSYKDSGGYHFLNPETYEDVAVFEDIVEPVKDYLMEGSLYTLLFTDGIVASIDLPASMVMTVTESSEGVKGDSANNVYKPATMETGLIVQVPLFINVGEKINVITAPLPVFSNGRPAIAVPPVGVFRTPQILLRPCEIFHKARLPHPIGIHIVARESAGRIPACRPAPS
jgi:elongation factor P